MDSLKIDLPEEALLGASGRPGPVRRGAPVCRRVQWYHQGLISGSKAAVIAGMTRLDFLDELARRRLDTVKIDLGEVEAEPTGSNC